MITIDLFEILQAAWLTICADYDIVAEVPDMGDLFDGIYPASPADAAQVLLVNLLSEAMECVSRFSPWYKQPVGAFGIVLEHDAATQTSQWALTHDAIQAYAVILAMLEHAIERNKSVILATRFLDDLEQQDALENPCQTATCRCSPPRIILVHRSIIGRAPIICDACHQPFT